MNEPLSTDSDWRIVCSDLGVHRGGRSAIADVNLTLGDGECVSIVGPNGAGKTTLLLAMLGLLPPACGTLRLNGREMHKLPPRERGRFVAYVPQSVELLPAFSVRDVVAGGRFPHAPRFGPLSDSDEVAVDQALDRCGLSGLRDRALDAISGGERQKALIAAAIAQDPSLLLLDEPTSALDPAYRLELLGILRDWHSSGRSLVLVSHDLQLPAALGGRVLALRAGKLVADGPSGEVLTPECLAGIYNAEFFLAQTDNGFSLPLPRWR